MARAALNLNPLECLRPSSSPLARPRPPTMATRSTSRMASSASSTRSVTLRKRRCLLLFEQISFIVFRWNWWFWAPDVLQLCPCVTFDITNLFCFTAETGKLQWEAEKGGQTKSRPTGNRSSLYVLNFGKWRSLMCGNVVGSCGEVRGGRPQS